MAAIKKRFPLASTVTTGSVFRSANGSRYYPNDVVRIGLGDAIEIGEVWWHCNVDGANYTCVSVWPPAQGASAQGANTFAIENNPQFRNSDEINASAIRKRVDDQMFVVWP